MQENWSWKLMSYLNTEIWLYSVGNHGTTEIEIVIKMKFFVRDIVFKENEFEKLSSVACY